MLAGNGGVASLTFNVLFILLSCIKYLLVTVASPSSPPSTNSAKLSFTLPRIILSPRAPEEYSCMTSKWTSDSCSMPLRSNTSRTGRFFSYSQDTLCSLISSFDVRPRCSAELEEDKCHLTYEVPETSGTLLRSIIFDGFKHSWQDSRDGHYLKLKLKLGL